MAEKDHPMQISGPDRIAFGQRLTLLREEKGYTKKELCRLLEDFDNQEYLERNRDRAPEDWEKEFDEPVYGQNLIIWEKGRKIPNKKNLYKLCYIFGVTADELLKGKI